jgi:uncharacterized protein (TIGR00290 family)
MKTLWMSWSSGKDSAFALLQLLRNPQFRVTGLFCTVNSDFERVAMHSTRLDLLHRQAEALGLPLELVEIPAACSNDIYEEAMRKLFAKARQSRVQAMGFGDLFLEDIRAYRERQLAGSGIEAIFPLWGRPTKELAREMWAAGLEATLTCVDPRQLPASFAGRDFDIHTVDAFPSGVDPCGENGEFHTFVHALPAFRHRIPVRVGERVERGGFVFADVLPAESAQHIL